MMNLVTDYSGSVRTAGLGMWLMKQLLEGISICGVKIQIQPVLEINLLMCSYFGEGKSINQQVFFINLKSSGVLERWL